MNKRIFARLCTLGLILSSTGELYAYDGKDAVNESTLKIIETTEDNTVVGFNSVNLNLPYKSEDINITCEEYENKIEYTVTDVATNEVLTIFGEETLKVESNVYFKETNSIGQRISKNLYADFNQGPCTMRLNQPITYNTSGSFRWIDGAGKATLNQVSGGDWSFSSTNLANNWKGTQLNKIQVDAMTTLVVKTNSNIVSGSFSKKSLENAGFNVQLTSSSNFVNYYTARFTPSKRFGFTWDISTNQYTYIHF